MSGDALGSAHRVMDAHEEAMKAANLDGVVANAADDIVVLLPGSPLIEGRGAFQEFYGQLLAAGPAEFQHHYSGEEVLGNAAVFHGVARGTATGSDGSPTAIENNFILVLKPDAAGQMKIWRIAFGPASM